MLCSHSLCCLSRSDCQQILNFIDALMVKVISADFAISYHTSQSQVLWMKQSCGWCSDVQGQSWFPPLEDYRADWPYKWTSFSAKEYSWSRRLNHRDGIWPTWRCQMCRGRAASSLRSPQSSVTCCPWSCSHLQRFSSYYSTRHLDSRAVQHRCLGRPESLSHGRLSYSQNSASYELWSDGAAAESASVFAALWLVLSCYWHPPYCCNLIKQINRK